MYKHNPKQVGSNLIDANPQKGPCPQNCNQCFYNRYAELWKPNIPAKKTAEGKIVRMNALHDSNIKKAIVLNAARRYKDVFFNTSIPNFDFPKPIVFTANSQEEMPVEMDFLNLNGVEKLMFVRLRVSPTNLTHIDRAVRIIFEYSCLTTVLTFMRYYDTNPVIGIYDYYTWKKHISNFYWCPTNVFKRHVLEWMQKIAGKRVTICGSFESDLCVDCKNCESFYWQTIKYLKENEK